MTTKSYSIQRKYGKKAIDIILNHIKNADKPLYPMDIYNNLTKAQVYMKMSTIYTTLMRLKAMGKIVQEEAKGPYTDCSKFVPTMRPKVKEVDMSLETPDAEYLYVCNHTDNKVSVFPASELLTLADEQFFNDGDELIHVQVKCRKKVKLETIVKTRFLPAGEE